MSNADLDFVFIDQHSAPFRVRKISGEYWVLYLNGKQWVTLRKVATSTELWRMEQAAIDKKLAYLYENGIPFLEGGWPK